VSPELLRALASIVLYLHFTVVLFNVFWIIAIPLGAWLEWSFIRSFWWRVTHLALLGVVALQAAVGALCFLTIWQKSLIRAAGGPAGETSLIDDLVTRAIFWPLPMWAFVVLYVAALVFAVSMWWLVPPRRPAKQ
jgi:hypothetical protein